MFFQLNSKDNPLAKSGLSLIRVRAQYLVGADGAHSSVREALGINMVGPAGISHSTPGLEDSPRVPRPAQL